MEEKETFGQKVKGHFKKHKGKYIAGGVGLTIGIVGSTVFRKGLMANVCNRVGVAINSPINNITNINQTLVRRGHAGNVIRCLETGETFASQNRACDLLGLNRADLSNHLNGLKDNIKGLHFEKVGDFNSK